MDASTRIEGAIADQVDQCSGQRGDDFGLHELGGLAEVGENNYCRMH